jgi:membrane-bound ClpP family serine protease
MKLLGFITHPYTLIISFFGIMISGEHMGGFYLLYLLMALPHFGSYAILALLAVILLIVSFKRFRNENYRVGNVLNIAGVFLLILSLFIFFWRDVEHYNYSTFYELVPQISLVIFAIVSIAFLYTNVVAILRNYFHKAANETATNSAGRAPDS